MDRLEYTSIESMKLRLTDLEAILENGDFSENPEYEDLLSQEKANLESLLNSIFYE